MAGKLMNWCWLKKFHFFNKANVIEALNIIPENSKVIIDCSKSKSIAYDVVELIKKLRE